MTKNIVRVLFIFSSILILSGCGRAARTEYIVMDGFAQGTTYHFVVNSRDTSGLRKSVDSLFETVDASMSLCRENSLINRLNRNETDSVDSYITYCLEQAAAVSSLSEGRYDVTVKPLTEAWGFAGKDAQKSPDVDSLLAYVGWEKIRIENGRLIKEHPAMQIDLNSIAKGYTVDLMGRLMESRGITDYLIEIGGEIFCRGVNSRGEKWLVGIDRPVEGNFIPGADLQVKLRLSGEGLATSGNYRKYYTDDSGRKVVHTINARTGMSEISNLLSATVVAENSAIADAYGTMFMVTGLERSIEFLSRNDDVLACLIYAGDGGEYKTYISPRLLEMIAE